jgi:hypothetical protein
LDGEGWSMSMSRGTRELGSIGQQIGPSRLRSSCLELFESAGWLAQFRV